MVVAGVGREWIWDGGYGWIFLDHYHTKNGLKPCSTHVSYGVLAVVRKRGQSMRGTEGMLQRCSIRGSVCFAFLKFQIQPWEIKCQGLGMLN